MKIRSLAAVIALVLLAFGTQARVAADAAEPLDQYNVVWDSPSGNSSGSMPIGNGDIGMNVWVDSNGDLLLLISKTDAWGAGGDLLKLGRVRITLSPSPFAKGQPFRQELRLRDGMIKITGGAAPTATVARVWVDANRPVIRVECDGAQPFDVTAQLEVWRTEKRPFQSPDTVVDGGDRVVWYHRNEDSVWPGSMKQQGLGLFMSKMKDPLLNRTFGAALGGTGLGKKDARTLKSSQPATSHVISIYPLTDSSATPQDWQDQLSKSIQAADAVDLAKARTEHRKWWNDFWNRSWVRISGNKSAETVTRAYTLQRWVSACAGRGAFPIKFNGSIFTVENWDANGSDPDFRLWGGAYWWQNTRLPYWPMLASGDYDMLLPMFRMYLNTLELAKERNRIAYGCQGAFMPETMTFYGLWQDGDYGASSETKKVGDADSRWIHWIWTSGLDLSMMMLDYYDHTQDEKFVKEQLLPWADAMILYFDTRFKRDAAGKLVLDPTQSIETYQTEVINDTPNIAGLRAVLPRLLALPAQLADGGARQRWARLLKEIPEIPITERDGKKYVLPAGKFGARGNCENPELYTVFPFRIFGVGKPDLDMARDTFLARGEGAFHGWQQTAVQAAYLGSPGSARTMLVSNASTHHAKSRFPAFWGPNYDWTPDQCHGGNILNTAQTMLLQCEGRKILLLPAWPADWDVHFKLHAPLNTTVEAVVKGGKVQTMKVTPASRAKDVEVVDPSRQRDIGPSSAEPLLSNGEQIKTDGRFIQATRLGNTNADLTAFGIPWSKWPGTPAATYHREWCGGPTAGVVDAQGDKFTGPAEELMKWSLGCNYGRISGAFANLTPGKRYRAQFIIKTGFQDMFISVAGASLPLPAVTKPVIVTFEWNADKASEPWCVGGGGGETIGFALFEIP